MADNPLSMSLKARIKILENENTELKRQVQTLHKMIPKNSTIDISDEHFICEVEIKRLRDIALSRPLNLEETKKLDILIKNYKDIKEREKVDAIEVKSYNDIPTHELIEIAGDLNEESKGHIETTGSDS